MGTPSYDNYADLITFTRSSVATALAKISYGSELVTNGTFDTDTTGWTADAATMSIESGRLRITNTGANGEAYTSFTCVVGQQYLLTLNSYGGTSGGAWYLSEAAPNNYSGGMGYEQGVTGRRVHWFTATATTVYLRLENTSSGVGTYAEWDNVSITTVVYDQPDGTLQLFEHPVDQPRVEYAADGTRKGILVEEARTNLLTYSNDQSHADWSKDGTSITVDQAVSPDGATNASSAIENSATDRHGFYYDHSSFAAGTNHTFSAYVKNASGSRFVRLCINEATSGHFIYATFNPRTGEITQDAAVVGLPTAIQATSEDCGNGWYRISVTGSTSAAGKYTTIALTSSGTAAAGTDYGYENYTGDSTSGVYIYGIQFEVGAFPTSYIKTTTASVTRSADVASIATSAFGYNQKAGTMVVEFSTPEGWVSTSNSRVWGLGSASTDRMSLHANTGTDDFLYYVKADNAAVANLTKTTNSSGQSASAATGYKLNDFAYCTDGGAVDTDSSGAVPAAATTFRIGDYYAGNYPLNGHIKSIAYYPRRLSNAQLQELTA